MNETWRGPCRLLISGLNMTGAEEEEEHGLSEGDQSGRKRKAKVFDRYRCLSTGAIPSFAAHRFVGVLAVKLVFTFVNPLTRTGRGGGEGDC